MVAGGPDLRAAHVTWTQDMTCELHDEVSAGSQFVTHFTGRILEPLGRF